MVSFDTSLSSWKGKFMMALPLIAGGVLGEYADQKGYDEKLLSASFIPKLGQPFDKLAPIALLFVVFAIFVKTSDMGKSKFSIGALMAGAMLGLMTNYTAKMIMSGKTAGGAV